MKRYWIQLERTSDNNMVRAIGAGIGVTAYNYTDALQLIGERIFHSDPVPRVVHVIEDVDVSKLDTNHILPNMHPPNRRGIWFPIGYE